MASKMKSFYKGKKILLTGGTGFMGLSMVEKLLRTFPEIGTIYMLARDKEGITLDDRKKTYFDNKVFDRLKKERTDYNKLQWIYGDITKSNLGMTRSNIKMIQDNVDLIIHGAALLTFSLPLKAYVETGVRAVDDLLKIAEGCKKLEGFMYISTAYAQTRITPNAFTTETVLKHPIPVRELLDMSNRLTTEEMEWQSRKLVQEWFNYYMYCKNATENLITEYEGKFPIAIFRPSIVFHSYEEPTPYFIGNNTGFGRVLMEAARGKIIYTDPEVNANSVPVDLTVNGALAALQNTAQDNKLTVYNYSTNSNPCSFADAFRYYSMSIPDYQEVLVPYRYTLLNLNKLPKGSLEEKQRKNVECLDKFLDRVRFSMFMDWKWNNSNIDALWDQQNDVDKGLLPFDVRACDWKKYYSNMYANQWGLPEFPKFENLTKERRAELRKQSFYLHCFMGFRRSFPEISTIYMMAHNKEGVTLGDRKKAHFDNKVFDRLKKEHDKVNYNKLKWIYGNITKSKLGMTKRNLKMIQDDLDLIIHGVAQLTFSLLLKAVFWCRCCKELFHELIHEIVANRWFCISAFIFILILKDWMKIGVQCQCVFSVQSNDVQVYKH